MASGFRCSALAARNDWQQDVGGSRSVVIDGLGRVPQLGLLGHWSARIRIAVKAREVAARYLDADAMALQEYVAGDTGIHSDLIGLDPE